MKFFAPFRISENISKTPEGYLLCRNVSIGRTGEMVYGVGETPIEPGPDGKVYVTRTAEELFRPETVASFEGKALTILHPEDFVNPKNWAQLTKGIVQNVRRGKGEQENDLVADFLVTMEDAIELVESGLREVSCGYEAEYTQTGVGRGFQSQILGNHVALVEEGRAGALYAINDHKGKGSSMKVSDKIKAIFAKAQDDAMKACGDNATQPAETISGDAGAFDAKAYMDEKFGKLMDAMSAMGKKDEPAKDAGEKQDPSTGKPAEPAAKDADSELATTLKAIMERLDKLEGAATGDAEEEEETGDESEEESEETGDEEEVGSGETGDSAGGDEDEDEELDVAARAEILAPGLKAPAKELKAKALLAAYATADGKQAIHQFTDGKKPNVKDEASCNALFVGVSEVLRVKRAAKLAGARPKVRDNHLSSLGTPKGAKSAEDINEINAKHYSGKK